MVGGGGWAVLIAAMVLSSACAEKHSFSQRPRAGAAAEAGMPPEDAAAAGMDARPPLADAAQPRSDRYPFCARADDDVSDAFCAFEPPAITGLVELKAKLGFGGAGYAFMLGHSTGLGGRLASPINPRAIFARFGVGVPEYVAFAFTRGEQRVELVSLDRTTTRYNFYLLEFTQACNAEPGGCTFGDRFTPAIESDWLELHVRDDEELKNTKDDCRRCHGGGPHDPDKPILLMRELTLPWKHWFSNGLDSLQADFRAAHGQELYAAARSIENPGVLENEISRARREYGLPTQPLLFSSEVIGTETKEIVGTRSGPGADDHDLAESPTWRLLYDAYRSGRAPAPPYHHERITDPDKLATATAAYKAFVAGAIERDELPDISDVLPDEQSRLAQMSFAVEPDAVEGDLLIQACGECHNAGLDPTLSRAHFDADLSRVEPAGLVEAVARLELPEDDPRAMPPPGARTMSAAQRRGLIAYLRTVDPAEVPGRPSPRQPPPTYTLEVGYEFHDRDVYSPTLAIVDLTGDGRLDLLASPHAFAQNEDGTLADPSPLPGGASDLLAILDVEGDDWVDLVARGPIVDGAEATPGLSTFLATGEAEFGAPIASTGPNVFNAQPTDVDRDGRVDLVAQAVGAGYEGSPVVAYRGDGAGGFAPSAIVLDDLPVISAGGMGLGDLTGDGLDDLVLYDTRNPGSIVVYAHDGIAGYGPLLYRQPLPADLTGRAYLAIGDADSDGRNDIVASPHSRQKIGFGARLLRQRDDGSFAPAPVIDLGSGPLVFADVDRDGRQDLVGLFEDDELLIVLLQGPDGLQYARSLRFRIPEAMTGPTSFIADSLAVGDLDSDGCPDVAVARSRLIAVFYGKGCAR